MDLIHDGKTKKVYQDPESADREVIEFTDFIATEDAKKSESVAGKAELALKMTEFLLGYLEGKGIDTHFVRSLESPRILVRKVEIYPVSVVCRNIATKSFCLRSGVEEGRVLEKPLVEFFLENDKLHNPLITERAIETIGLVKDEILYFMRAVTLSVNYYLVELLKQQDLVLADFRLRFGITKAEHIVVADELSLDNMSIWKKHAPYMSLDKIEGKEEEFIQAYGKLVDLITRTKPEEVKNRTEILQVLVKPKDGIRNPPGEVTKKMLVRMGFGDADDVRVGKVFNIILRRPITSEILHQLNIMNIKLLSNPISEKHEVSYE
jgi:phosphoribosylaminoimidazole-succinocarboxamide synthase